jgi:hypothetical protein
MSHPPKNISRILALVTKKMARFFAQIAMDLWENLLPGRVPPHSALTRAARFATRAGTWKFPRQNTPRTTKKSEKFSATLELLVAANPIHSMTYNSTPARLCKIN